MFSQNDAKIKVEPPNWWTEMKNKELQLLVYYPNIAETDVVIDSKLVKLVKVNTVENKNYLFIDLLIDENAKAGNFDIAFNKGKKNVVKYNYVLNEKTAQKRGFSSADFIYLVMPDRFANGNPDNDNSADTYQKVNREDGHARHGGDIQGLVNKLDYLKELGVTAIWATPIQENNTKIYSYHGYGMTDFYRADPRLGTNEEYVEFVKKCHQKEIKVIMDMVFNHCGDTHWWIKDLPEKSWLNTDSLFTTNYRGSTVVDPHASEYDAKKMVAGWFVARMPDLNQYNKYLANYLIQNSLWWIEFAGIDAIRMDTQPYSYKEFMAKWAERVHLEYPDFTLLGETWLDDVANVAYFKGDTKIQTGYNSGLNTITDFPLNYAMRDAFNQEDGWASGLSRLYSVLVQDFLYGDANTNVTFLDNHDIDRYFSSVDEKLDKMLMGFGFMLTTRGTPTLYYGSEILMNGKEHWGHPTIRKDFPGGWKEDKINAFTKEGRTDDQNTLHNFITKVANYRKTSKALTEGKLVHFVPDNNTYVYFRYTDNEAVMVILNNHNTEERTINKERYAEILKKYSSATNIVTAEKLTNLDNIKVPKKSITILQLNK